MILAIGDSLGVGSDPFLRERVAHVRTDSRSGRTAAQGLRILRHRPATRTIVFALGTNDFDKVEYERVLRHVRRENPHSCLIFVSIYRHGAVKALNRAQRMIPRSKIVPWAHLVAHKHRILASDGVHATIRGYRLRARLISAKIKLCTSNERTP